MARKTITSDPTEKRVALYVRVSTADQADDGTSLEEQQKRGTAYCIAQGWPEPTVYVDAGESGAKASRPSFDRMMADVRAGRIDVVLVTSADRAGRSLANMVVLYDELDRLKVAFVSVKESFDSSTPSGRLMRNMLASFAEYEREVIRERTISGSLARVKEGAWVGGDTPFGYRVEDGRLVPDPKEAKIVRHMAKRLAAGASTTELSADLNRRGWSPRKVTTWSQSNLRSTITKHAPVWGGSWTYGKSGETDPITVTLPESILPAIEAAQLADYVKSTTRPRSANAVHPLTGRVTCQCGFAMTGFNPKDRSTNRRYICSNSRGQKYGHDLSKRCALPRVPGDELDRVVWGEVLPLLRNPAVLIERAEAAATKEADALPVAEATLDAARRNLAETVTRGVRLGLDDAAIVLLKVEAQADFDAALASRDALLAAVAGGSTAKRALREAAALLDELMPTLEEPDELLMREVFTALDVKVKISDYKPLAVEVGGRLDFSALGGAKQQGVGYSEKQAATHR